MIIRVNDNVMSSQVGSVQVWVRSELISFGPRVRYRLGHSGRVSFAKSRLWTRLKSCQPVVSS